MTVGTMADKKATSGVHEALKHYPTLLQKLLAIRDITTKDAAELFLHPDFDRDTHDPSLLTGMGAVVQRIYKAVADRELIAIYSDYDMDGIPGAVVLADFFNALEYERVTHYVPGRNTEGFGLNTRAIEALAQRGVTLIITVDCGIRAVEQVTRARELGIDVIITDHHLPGDVVPEATSILNPLQSGDIYPNKHLCGAGVAFKLLQALAQDLDLGTYNVQPGWEKWSLDMVAAATVADMVPLVGENRALVHYGLRVLRKSPRPGLRRLCRLARAEQAYLTEDDVVFSIAPRINAASRMGEADRALALLTATDREDAREHAVYLEKLNKERKGTVAAMVRQMKKTVPVGDTHPDVLVIGDPRWEPGLLGLVAQRAVELYDRPVCVWGRGSASEVKGSCRSNGTLHVVELLESARDVLVDYGGHERSGGFSIGAGDVHALKSRFAGFQVQPTEEATATDFDTQLGLEDVSWEIYRTIEQLAPFGVGNPKPTFLFSDVEISGFRRFGSGNVHLELSFDHPAGQQVRAIQFFADKKIDAKCEEGRKINLAAHLEQSFFGGTPELRLRIVYIN